MSAHPDEGFLALLVQRGHLELDQARALLPSLRDGGSLDALLVEHAGWTEDKVRLLRRTRAGEQPLLPGYEVLGRLGVGGTAEVFRARDKRDGGRTVALKILDARPMQARACACIVKPGLGHSLHELNIGSFKPRFTRFTHRFVGSTAMR